MHACSPGRQSSRGEGLSGVWASSKSVSSSRRTETPPALWQGRVTSTWSGSRHGGQRPQRGTGRQSQSRLPLTHLGRWTMGGPASKEHPVWHMTLKSGCPQRSLREANNLSSSVPMEGTPHPLPWGPCGLQEATLQRTGPAGSVSRRAVVWGGGGSPVRHPLTSLAGPGTQRSHLRSRTCINPHPKAGGTRRGVPSHVS